MPKNLFAVAVIIAVLAALYTYFSHIEPTLNTDQITDSPLENLPTALSTNVTTKKYRSDGGIDFYFEAQRAEFFQTSPKQSSSEDYMVLNSPYAILFKQDRNGNNNATWYLTANSGRAFNDFRTVELSDDVNISKPQEKGQIAEVNTSQLTLETDTQFVHTKSPVDLRLSNSYSHAREGMEAYLKEEKFDLFQTKTTYEK
jgi:LPS export ABC transporter protein LptC